MSSLCCLINPFINCEACANKWCYECWQPGADGEGTHPTAEDYASHQSFDGSYHYRRVCVISSCKVEYIIRTQGTNAITFKVLTKD